MGGSGKKEEKSKALPVVIFIFVGLLVIGFFMFLVLGLLLAPFSTSTTSSGTGNILVIPIHGEITTTGAGSIFYRGVSSTSIISLLEEAENNNRIHGVVLEIDSPGGTPVASHEVVKAVKDFSKPSVAVIRETGASGAYWIASATDHIISDELSLTGSVGVMAGFLNFHGFLRDYNITYEQLSGGEYKDAGSPFREMTSAERDELIAKVSLMHEFFAGDVANNRGLNEEQREEVMTGIFFLGLEAMNLGLVDEFGGEKEAKEYFERVLERDVELFRKPRRTGFMDAFLGLTNIFSFNALQGAVMLESGNPGFRLE